MKYAPESSLFKYVDYKDYLRDLLHARKAPRGLQSQMARHLGCQASYLYQVLRGKAELTEDQAFRVTSFVEFSLRESEYFLTLVRFSKAVAPEWKKYLREKLRSLVAEEMDLKNKSDAVAGNEREEFWDYYFSSSTPSLLHILTSSENYPTAETLARKLALPVEMIQEHLRRLADYGLVEKKNNRWVFAGPSRHLGKNSKHNLSQQLIRRSQAMHSVSEAESDATHFSTLFTLDAKSYEKLRIEVGKFIEKVQRQIHQGGSDEAFVMNIDLFRPAPTRDK